MENNKTYLEKLPIVALITLVGVALQVFFFKAHMTDWSSTARMIYTIIDAILYHGVFFLSLGILLQKWRQAGIAFTVAVVSVLIEYFVFRYDQTIKDDEHAGRSFLLTQLLYILPQFIFFISGRFPLKKLGVIFLGIIVFRGMSVGYNSPNGIETMIKIFWRDVEKYYNYISMFIFIAMNIAALIFYCELQYFAEQKEPKWQPKLLNPGNEYPKGGATIVFFVLKTALVVLTIGVGFVIGKLRYFLLFESGNPIKYFYYNNMLNALFAVPVVIFGAFYLRKFLLEYAVSHRDSSKFLHWLLILPVVGSITWLVSLNNKSNTNLEEKAAAINEYARSSSQGVTLLNILLMCFPLIKALSNGAGAGMLAIFISIAFFIWLVSDRSGYYFNLYLSLTVMLIIAVIIFGTKKEYNLYELATYYALLLYNISQLILIYPVYHFKDFSYLHEETAVAEMEKNSLSEFES